MKMIFPRRHYLLYQGSCLFSLSIILQSNKNSPERSLFLIATSCFAQSTSSPFASLFLFLQSSRTLLDLILWSPLPHSFICLIFRSFNIFIHKTYTISSPFPHYHLFTHQIFIMSCAEITVMTTVFSIKKRRLLGKTKTRQLQYSMRMQCHNGKGTYPGLKESDSVIPISGEPPPSCSSWNEQAPGLRLTTSLYCSTSKSRLWPQTPLPLPASIWTCKESSFSFLVLWFFSFLSLFRASLDRHFCEFSPQSPTLIHLSTCS